MPSEREARLECPRCGHAMEEGFVLTLGAGTHMPAQAEWVAGRPEAGLFGVRLKGRRRLPVAAYRCTGCGRIEFFAPPRDQ